jgi:hypothetical protein
MKELEIDELLIFKNRKENEVIIKNRIKKLFEK